MASTSYSQPNNTKFDVFVSFRGEDTRNTFTSHLFSALGQARINAFMDNYHIRRGENLTTEIMEGIKESKVFIVVLSENYAKSKWCLEELCLILEQRRKSRKFVLPVFYHIDTSDVKKQLGSFLIKADDGVEGSNSKWTVVNVNRWKAALSEVGDLAGMDVSSRAESEFIADIVDRINHKLDLRLFSTPTHLLHDPTPIETQAKHFYSWLDNEEPNDDVYVICGMGGGGKTTLAQYIYDANKQKFESSSFLLDIGFENKKPYGLLNLKKQLMSATLGMNIKLDNECEGTSRIVEALRGQRMLIVLDDIDNERELDVLLGPNHSGTKSKIIITTRMLDLVSWFKSNSWRCNVYELKLLNVQDSVKLFCHHAFISSYPMEGFEKLAQQLAKYCEGNPLALKILGSSLFTTAEDMQARNDKIEQWRSKLNLLNSSVVDQPIQNVLIRSYDSLPNQSVKDLFLHIACFFVGEYKDYVATILETDWYANSGITILINRCLLTISPGNKLIMHQLLQDMAKEIVRAESIHPRKRSRVWDELESFILLSDSEGSKEIEGLALDMRKLHSRPRWVPTKLYSSSLLKLKRLKLLRLINVKFDGNYDGFPRLRWLCWHNCNLKKIPGCLFMSSLVALDMSNGECEKFESPEVLYSLKILNLKGSHKLLSINKLDRFPNLESLILWDCDRLSYLCTTIGSHQRLARLDLTGCKKLMDFNTGFLWRCFGGESQKQLFFSPPASLEFLFLNNIFPEGDFDVPELKSNQSQHLYVNLGNSLFKFMPRNIVKVNLGVLDLTCCPNLKSLEHLPNTLEELYTYRCKSLEKIRFQSARFKLRKFGYGGCTKLSEIQGLFKLVPIKELSEANLGVMKWIKGYQDLNMVLVGDVITKRRFWHIQMLHEYGIRSTFLPKHQRMNMPGNMIFSSLPKPQKSMTFSFRVGPGRIEGLCVTSLYRSSGEDADMLVLIVTISNKTKGLTWIYNPVVFGKPIVGEDVVWLSYWPIILNAGDEVHVSIFVGNGLMVTGIAVEYGLGTESRENYTTEEEVIGGNLSEFKLTTGAYYLCRRDFQHSTSPDWSKVLFGDTFDYTEFQGWRKSRLTFEDDSFMGLQTFRGLQCGVTEIIAAHERIRADGSPKRQPPRDHTRWEDDMRHLTRLEDAMMRRQWTDWRTI